MELSKFSLSLFLSLPLKAKVSVVEQLRYVNRLHESGGLPPPLLPPPPPSPALLRIVHYPTFSFARRRELHALPPSLQILPSNIPMFLRRKFASSAAWFSVKTQQHSRRPDVLPGAGQDILNERSVSCFTCWVGYGEGGGGRGGGGGMSWGQGAPSSVLTTTRKLSLFFFYL